MDSHERAIKRSEMEQHNDPANRRRFVERTDRGHKAELDDHGALGQFKRTLRSEARGRVLDVCCGEARFAEVMLRHDSSVEYHGIDLSKVRVGEAGDRLGDDGNVVVGDAEYLPYEDGSFDTVVSSAALHHLPQWDDRAMDEIVRVLKPDGTLVFREPLKYNPFAYVFRRLAPGPCHTEHESPFDPNDFREVLDGRFESVDMTGHYIAALLFPFLDGLLPVDIPVSLTLGVYDVERKLIDNGAMRLATHSHGVAKSPRG